MTAPGPDALRFDRPVEFAPGRAVSASVVTIRATNLHAHPGVIEILCVLRGALHVRVSSESFDLGAGDFLVINEDDPHLLEGDDANATAIIHVRLADFLDVDPLIEHIVFACESFDLVRHNGEEAALRASALELLETALAPAESGGEGGGELALCRRLLTRLCSDYSLERYNNRSGSPSAHLRRRYREVFRSLRDGAENRTILAAIAAEQHFSRSYVSHLVKNVSGLSFSTLLGFLRIWRAEKLVIRTELTMLEISAQCGFSDTKYFTRTFLAWFGVLPAAYRRQSQAEIRRPDRIAAIDGRTAHWLIETVRRMPAAPASSAADPPAATEHLTPVTVTEQLVRTGAASTIARLRAAGLTPYFVLQFESAEATGAVIDALLAKRDGYWPMRFWVHYSADDDRARVDALIRQVAARANHVTLVPVRLP
ncbi:helix-turn-helix domain-containing protein [Herbiconiux sp. YIM B11900]|uniref:helix-turn-helix transcriptional regulator n=1 Tax=Herbiconiux sp. YIM B11900 TaxID=3404131 RepID=UPI003F84E150